ncbi:MAG TPA: DUF2267 domain-containing protein [Polyangiaceae bacterium]
MQPSSYSDIIRRLRELGPFADDAQASAALAASLALLGAVLTGDERDALTGALPSELAEDLRQSPAWALPLVHTDQSFALGAEQAVALNQAIQHSIIVCRALGEILTPTARARLAQAVPALASTLEPPTYIARSPSANGSLGEDRQPRSCGLQEEREARALATRPGWRRLLSNDDQKE